MRCALRGCGHGSEVGTCLDGIRWAIRVVHSSMEAAVDLGRWLGWKCFCFQEASR